MLLWQKIKEGDSDVFRVRAAFFWWNRRGVVSSHRWRSTGRAPAGVKGPAAVGRWSCRYSHRLAWSTSPACWVCLDARSHLRTRSTGEEFHFYQRLCRRLALQYGLVKTSHFFSTVREFLKQTSTKRAEGEQEEGKNLELIWDSFLLGLLQSSVQSSNERMKNRKQENGTHFSNMYFFFPCKVNSWFHILGVFIQFTWKKVIEK